MPTNGFRVAALAALPLLAACETEIKPRPLSTFGEANRQTMIAQVIDPEPEYEYLDPETSGDHAADAIDRYRNDRVKRPQRVSTTSGN